EGLGGGEGIVDDGAGNGSDCGGATVAQPASTDNRLAAIQHLMKPQRMVPKPAIKAAPGDE
ncbi:MAG: hypothetical protein WAW46_01125, partial [Polaromonas sp.]